MKPLIVSTTDGLNPEIVKTHLAPVARLVVATRPAVLRRELKRADALITTFADPVIESLLKGAPRLKAIGNFAVGINNIDLEACARRGIRVVNTPGVLTRATAELTLALLLAAARRVPEGEKLCRANRFKGWHPSLLLGLELKGRTAVIVGPGRIGRETGRLFRAIGMKVRFIGRETSAEETRALLKTAQVLSLHFPLTPKTLHWLNRARLALLPRDAIVLNTTRGPTIDEKALIQALKSRRIFAAGLDVFENEPEIPAALRRLPNVVLLPHVGSATEQARREMARLVVTGVVGILGGKHPSNEVKF